MSKAKLKKGDKFIYTKEMNEAKLKSYNNEDASEYIGKELTISFVDTTTYDMKDIDEYSFDLYVIDDFHRKEITFENCRVGDIVHEDGEDEADTDNQMMVLMRNCKLIALSTMGDFEEFENNWYTEYQFDMENFVFLQKSTQGAKEMTVEEISKALGHEVKVVKK